MKPHRESNMPRRRSTQVRFHTLLAAGVLLALSALAEHAAALELPYAEAGLTEHQAAAHLLDRFAYGARPGDVERVVAMGIETWLAQQLAASAPEHRLAERLAPYDILNLSAREIGETFPNPALLLRRAMSEREERGVGDDDGSPERADLRRELRRLQRSGELRDPRQLTEQLLSQKLLRAVYAENQLTEVMTDFWFNHFNVSIRDAQTRSHVLSYERDAIRPHVLGDFGELLAATARHPAMLFYLDNAQSRAADGARTTLDTLVPPGRFRAGRGDRDGARMPRPARAGLTNRPTGLNENYARELLELHTLGVDGGFTQEDVVAVARAFTGWSALPSGFGASGDPRLERARSSGRLQRRGFSALAIADDGFFFNPAAHDAARKTVLGHTLRAGRGLEDGKEVLDLLAAHASTARFVARKLAVRFVCDEPPQELVERMAETFERTGGDIAAVLSTLVESPELWSAEARRQKIKSPFELAASALRALDAEVFDPRPSLRQIAEMGQPLYAYQAPTGYPDRAAAWVSSGALLLRMNFGLDLAIGRVPGVRVDLSALLDGHEPESATEAVRAYGAVLIPQRDLVATIGQIEPLLTSADLVDRVAERKAVATEEQGKVTPGEEAEMADLDPAFPVRPLPPAATTPDSSAAAQIVGLLLGSPEFQRR
jgi:uncharacterized protein (DUF1800 family)